MSDITLFPIQTGSLPSYQYVLTQTIEVPYTDFVSGTAAVGYNVPIPLTINAIRRKFVINNSINESLTGDTWAYDSNTNDISSIVQAENVSPGSITVATGTQAVVSTVPGGANWTDGTGLQWNIGAPSAAPTSGTLYINVYEMGANIALV